MHKPLTELASFLQHYALNHPQCSKDEIAKATESHFNLVRDGPVFHRAKFAIRFSTARGNSFSNVVLSLSTLHRYDHTPFIVCVVRPSGIELLLANTTFLKKVSHSSHQLRIDNVRGSFLGHDIMRTYNGIENTPYNFDTLFSLHTDFTWEEKVARLVEQTNAIVPTGIRFEPSRQEKLSILGAPKVASLLSTHPEYVQLGDKLTQLVHDNRHAILEAGRIDNVNLRGNTIEQIITNAGNFHSLDDIRHKLTIGTEVQVDIKTKILTLSSSPKGYNIDKVLRAMAVGNTVVSFFFVGINVAEEYIVTCLVSILDQTILNATRVQYHWAGRGSRGVTQLAGDLTSIFHPSFSENIDIARARDFLIGLIDLKVPVNNPDQPTGSS